MNTPKHIKNILDDILQITNNLSERTDEIHNLLTHYIIEKPVIDDLMNLIKSRNDIVELLNVKQQDLVKLAHDLHERDSENYMDVLNRSRDEITQKLSHIIELDNYNQLKISQLRDMVSDEIARVFNYKKLTRAYNIVTHRKAVFVDIESTR